MPERQDRKVTLSFDVAPGDADALVELVDAARRLAPSDACGFAGGGDLSAGRAWVVFTLQDASPERAEEVTLSLRQAVSDEVRQVRPRTLQSPRRPRR
jgi:hypothetical protein